VGTETTGDEAEAKFQRKEQWHKSDIRLPDLDHAKAAVVNSDDAKRGYRHAIDEFKDKTERYCLN
jgi:hypothetical protein